MRSYLHVEYQAPQDRMTIMAFMSWIDNRARVPKWSAVSSDCVKADHHRLKYLHGKLGQAFRSKLSSALARSSVSKTFYPSSTYRHPARYCPPQTLAKSRSTPTPPSSQKAPINPSHSTNPTPNRLPQPSAFRQLPADTSSPFQIKSLPFLFERVFLVDFWGCCLQ